MEFALSIGSALLSIIAIVISLAIAHRQNKIALFQIKFSALARIKDVISYAEIIENASFGAELLEFDRFFNTEISNDKISKNDKMIQTYGLIKRIDNELNMAFYSTKEQVFNDVLNLTKELENYVIDVINHKTSNSKDLFVKSAIAFTRENQKALNELIKL